MAEQGTGGIERQRRHLSTSQAKTENEPVPETTTKTRSQSTDQGKPQTVTEAELPRHSSPNTATPSAPSPSPSPVQQQERRPAATPSLLGTGRPHVHSTSSPSREERRKLEPPVTKHTLSELDVSKIIHNPKLRHDINFDPELHFRPNLDGEKGRKKQHKANQFWDALERQLNDFVNPNTRERFFLECGPGKDWCLPELLKAVKEIIQTLVPIRDRVYLDEGLNVDLIMQQFYQGVADLEKLALWLSRVLKSHCAPMRDEWVDEMYRQLSNGNSEGDMHKLVTGMRSLLSVLEAMKLDVANHQIRCLRPVLIEDTVSFEQKFFLKKMQSGRVNRSMVRSWFMQVEREYANDPAVEQTQQSFGDMAIFMNALSKLILPSTPTSNVPNTFLFDEERIVKLRSDLLDAINLEICMRMYEDLERMSPLRSINQANAESDAFASSDFNFNAPPSRPSSWAGSSCSSSPRNSGGIFSPPVMPSLAEIRTKNANVYNSLVALIQTAPHSNNPDKKWEALAPEMALQIFRFTDAPNDMLSNIEQRLIERLDQTHSAYREVEHYYHSRLLAELARRVKEIRGVSGVNLFSIATSRSSAPSSRTWNESREDGGRDESSLDDIAIRIAHLGILHWRVWAPIAYVEDTGMDFEPTETIPAI
ncbi:hypothetical protein MKZ38_001849 [Zalerion maritima]|uniref:Uncharacterized protein n=1 Tax=Zalerion maritima TaxID=339359 RepID=A0AAD5REV0_9PEZI|nr:hypothetical protein MKZ38_001849 [Zalerion maritima]